MSGVDVDLSFELDELVEVFGEPTHLSEPDLLSYWFTYERGDGVVVSLSLSGYERSVAVIVRVSERVAASAVRLEHCDAVRVLEADRRTLEVVAQNPAARCVLALDGDLILDVGVQPQAG